MKRIDFERKAAEKARLLAGGHQFRYLEAVRSDGDVDTIATDLTNQTLQQVAMRARIIGEWLQTEARFLA